MFLHLQKLKIKHGHAIIYFVDKEVFSLRVLGELSYQDIAKLFGKTESWARVTFHRAKLKIIEQVKEESYE